MPASPYGTAVNPRYGSACCILLPNCASAPERHSEVVGLCLCWRPCRTYWLVIFAAFQQGETNNPGQLMPDIPAMASGKINAKSVPALLSYRCPRMTQSSKYIQQMPLVVDGLDELMIVIMQDRFQRIGLQDEWFRPVPHCFEKDAPIVATEVG